MIFSDPLVLAIVSMITGMLLGAICCVLAVLIYTELHAADQQGKHLPDDTDMQQMCLWYDANYTEVK